FERRRQFGQAISGNCRNDSANRVCRSQFDHRWHPRFDCGQTVVLNPDKRLRGLAGRGRVLANFHEDAIDSQGAVHAAEEKPCDEGGQQQSGDGDKQTLSRC
ncbi:MAG: hypothetical protein OXL33_05910, partial [Chloroflexota bacterium]|nr:hypothetical protein [Chloroflexota bacterium]